MAKGLWPVINVDNVEKTVEFYKAIGLNPKKNYYVGQRPVPLTPPGSNPIATVLA